MRTLTYSKFIAKILFGITLIGVLLLAQSCEDLTDDDDQLTANAGDDIMVMVGNEVELDGSNSSSGSNITYYWSFESTPDQSNAQIMDASSVTASFTPDVTGVYTVELTVSDGATDATDMLTVTAQEDTTAQPIEISGNIDNDQTWTDHVNSSVSPDYIITGTVDLNAMLTIEKGVTVHIEENRKLKVNENGVLKVNGEAGNKVIITSANEAGNQYWGGIEIMSSDNRNTISYAEIKYGGGDEIGSFADYVDLGAIIGIHSNGYLNMDHTTISNSKEYGMYIRYGDLGNFSTNSFKNNTINAIGLNITQAKNIDNATTFEGNAHAVEIFGSTLDQNSEVTLIDLASDASYYLSGDIEINGSLEINDGANFKVATDKKLQINTDGALVADAAESTKITFTADKADAGFYWKGIGFSSSDSRNTLSNVEINAAGNSKWGGFQNYADKKTSVALMDDAKISLINTTVKNGDGYGLYVRDGILEDFSGNTFSSNTLSAIGMKADQVYNIDAGTSFSGNGLNGVEIIGSTLTQESTWNNLMDDATYHVIGNITVNSGLTFNPGVHITFEQDIFMRVEDGGYLTSEGTSSNNITLTSSNIAGEIHWGGVVIKTPDARNSFDYTTISWAGNSTMDLSNYEDKQANLGGTDNGRVSITNSTVSNSADYGVYFQGTINDIESAAANNTFNNNPSGNYYNQK